MKESFTFTSRYLGIHIQEIPRSGIWREILFVFKTKQIKQTLGLDGADLMDPR
jgi:hypothetical protein